MGEGVRRALLDAAPGERRGVVLLDGRPERLMIERDHEPPRLHWGEVHVGRLRALTPTRDRGYVELGVGPDGVAAFASGAAPSLGAAVRVEVASEAYAEKGPRLTVLGAAEGSPRRLSPAPTLEARLTAFAPGVALETGAAARVAANLAQEEALATTFPLGRGLTLHVQSTRALTAIDVDLAEGARGRRAAEADLRAIRHAVRLLRLKGLGGIAVIDLTGVASAARALAEARDALEPDGEGALALAPDRLGLLRLSRPRTIRPLAETLLDADGRPTPLTCALALARAVEREAAASPGGLIEARCAPEVAAALAPLLPALGPRVQATPEPARARERFEAVPR